MEGVAAEARAALLLVPEAVAAAFERDPSQALRRHLQRQRREWQAEQEQLQDLFDRLQQLPDHLRDRILCMAVSRASWGWQARAAAGGQARGVSAPSPSTPGHTTNPSH